MATFLLKRHALRILVSIGVTAAGLAGCADDSQEQEADVKQLVADKKQVLTTAFKDARLVKLKALPRTVLQENRGLNYEEFNANGDLRDWNFDRSYFVEANVDSVKLAEAMLLDTCGDEYGGPGRCSPETLGQRVQEQLKNPHAKLYGYSVTWRFIKAGKGLDYRNRLRRESVPTLVYQRDAKGQRDHFIFGPLPEKPDALELTIDGFSEDAPSVKLNLKG